MTLRAGVIGWPIQHSRSPALHGHWLKTHGIDGTYERIPVAPDDLEPFFRALPTSGLRGVNITIPHKIAAMDLVDEVAEEARHIGAINTVVVQGGRLLGSNTDAFGFAESLMAGAPGFRFDGGPAVVLGAGGAARAVVAALLARGVTEIRLANRDSGKTDWFVGRFGPRIVPVPWAQRDGALGGANLVVNTTSLGMAGQPALDLDLTDLPTSASVTDIVYVPLMTDLLRRAAARGHVIVDGLGMLLHQARPGFAAWFGREPVVTAELRAAVLAA